MSQVHDCQRQNQAHVFHVHPKSWNKPFCPDEIRNHNGVLHGSGLWLTCYIPRHIQCSDGGPRGSGRHTNHNSIILFIFILHTCTIDSKMTLCVFEFKPKLGIKVKVKTILSLSQTPSNDKMIMWWGNTLEISPKQQSRLSFYFETTFFLPRLNCYFNETWPAHRRYLLLHSFDLGAILDVLYVLRLPFSLQLCTCISRVMRTQ